MRNLKLVDSRHWSLEKLEDVRCISVDNDTGTVYHADQFVIIAVDTNNGNISYHIDLRSNESGINIGGEGIVSIQFIPDLQAVCVAVADGTLLQWSVFNNEVEEVGCVPSGLTGMYWSPDLELLILTTGDETFLLMTREYDPILEESLHTNEFGEAAFVTVGWGKKETQFHGSAGKDAAKKKIEQVKPVQEWDDLKIRISWRGDGQYFVTSVISRETGARQLRVWSRDGVLHSTSEQVDGLEQSLAWKPSGSLIASSQRISTRNEIVFFEKNGLRHGEFSLSFQNTDIKVRELLWNSDSSVLCVWCEDLPKSDSEKNKVQTYVQLWVVKNYHWYQKQSLVFDSDKRVSAIEWDPEHAYRLHLTTAGGCYHQYSWSWTIDHSMGKNEKNMALCAVLDGDKVLMTPFRRMVVPPPMCAYQLDLPTAGQQPMFCSADDSNDIAVLLQDNTVAVYTFNEKESNQSSGVTMGAAAGTGFTVQCKVPTFLGIYNIEGVEVSSHPLNIYHLLWVAADTFICCASYPNNRNSVLYKLCVDTADKKLKICCKTDVESFVYNICAGLSKNLAVQLVDGSVLNYDLETDTLLPWETSDNMELRFPSPCSTMDVCKISGQEVVLGLTDRFRFYVNNMEVASNCTSFGIHSEFLLLTTLSHTVRCISLNTKLKDLPTLADGKEHPFDESIRRIERGSNIVIVVPDDIKLILQMPRGNLEGIYPRALVLSAVRHYLDRCDFKTAFTVMKKHRINMNLLYDHNPQIFLENVEDFITQVNNVTDLNIFLTALQEENVTVTMYTAAYHKPSTPDQQEDKEYSTNKIDIICDSVRTALNKLNPDKYLLSILTTYVKKKKPELEAALELIRQLRENCRQNCSVSAEEALKYLLFLVDVNELYNVALGTYDFDLVLMVAEKSQKDPKEYIPFLNELRRMEDNYRKYTIDKYLRRFSKALKNICLCGASHFPECLKLIEEQKLYVEALSCFNKTSSEYKQVAIAYGNYLLEKNRHDEAGVMFVKAEEWELALEAFNTCKNWRQMFCMSARLGYTSNKESEIGRKMAERLKESRRHSEAALIYEQYVLDVEEAIVCLIEGEQWDEALRLMFRHKRTDFIETHLKTAIQDKHSQEMESLEGMRSQFVKYKNRLRVVRSNKEKERLEILEGGTPGMESDLFSDTSSAAGESVQSRYTYDSSRSTVISKLSGKSRKKGSVKKWNLKEGSSHEDCALIEALSKIITSVTGFKDDMNLLLKVLVQFHFDDEASLLQDTYEKFLSLIDSSMPEIWINSGESPSDNTVLGPNTTSNAIAQAMQQGKHLTNTTEKIEPVLVVPPQVNKDVRWKLHMVQKNNS